MFVHRRDFLREEMIALWRVLLGVPDHDVALARITAFDRTSTPRDAVGLERLGRFDAARRSIVLHDACFGWSAPSDEVPGGLRRVVFELVGQAIAEHYGPLLGEAEAVEVGRLYADFHLEPDRLAGRVEGVPGLVAVFGTEPGLALKRMAESAHEVPAEVARDLARLLPEMVAEREPSPSVPTPLDTERVAAARALLTKRYGGPPDWEFGPPPRPLEAPGVVGWGFASASRPGVGGLIAYEELAVAFDGGTLHHAEPEAFDAFARAMLERAPGDATTGHRLFIAWYGLTRGHWPRLVSAADASRPRVGPLEVGRDAEGGMWVRAWTRDVRARTYQRHIVHVARDGAVSTSSVDEGLVA